MGWRGAAAVFAAAVFAATIGINLWASVRGSTRRQALLILWKVNGHSHRLSCVIRCPFVEPGGGSSFIRHPDSARAAASELFPQGERFLVSTPARLVCTLELAGRQPLAQRLGGRSGRQVNCRPLDASRGALAR